MVPNPLRPDEEAEAQNTDSSKAHSPTTTPCCSQAVTQSQILGGLAGFVAVAAIFVAGFATGGGFTPSSSWVPLEPTLPGATPGVAKPRVILAIDIDYPPYATLVGPPAESDTVVGGFGPDVAAGLTEVCDIEVTVIEADWTECWDNDVLGESLKAGYYPGCMTYTHTVGTRNRYLEFSEPILENDKEVYIRI